MEVELYVTINKTFLYSEHGNMSTNIHIMGTDALGVFLERNEFS